MRSSIYIQNLRCGGCANTITKALENLEGITNVSVDVDDNRVSFATENDQSKLATVMTLKNIGYPPSTEQNSIRHKSKAIISCVKGKIA